MISDGDDNDSRYTESEIVELVRESDVWIYAIGLHESRAPISGKDEFARPSLLAKLAQQTGGKHFDVPSVADLPELAEQIGVELRNQYLLGYTPPGGLSGGRYHRVKVKLSQPKGMHVSARPGYYAPQQ